MKIEDLRNQRVKIGVTSITCKDKIGKTRGIVRYVRKFQQIHPAIANGYWHAIRESGIWENGLINNVVFVDDQIYYLHDLRPIETYQQLFAKSPDNWESETKRYNLLLKIAENAPKFNIAVIPCYVL